MHPEPRVAAAGCLRLGKIFIQGMRRSGTTILFDILSQDPRLDAYYEPFSITRGVAGGGSGAQEVDFGARIRELRQAYVAAHPEIGEATYFNYGAPRDPALELEPSLSDHARAYLRGMIEASTHTLIKTVRLYEKLEELHRLAPDALMIHVVRDPRRVATSQLVGPDTPPDRFAKEKDFFRRRGKGVLWASRALSEQLIQRRPYRHLADTYDVRRVLLVWKHTFRSTYDAGRRLFKDRYLLLKHEDLATDPVGWTRTVYERAGLDPEPAAIEFAGDRIRPPKPPLFPASERWDKAVKKVGLEPELRESGYAAVFR